MMSEKIFILCQDDLGNYEIRYDDKIFHFLWEAAPILNEQQATISKLEEENEQLKEKVKRLQDITTRTEEEKEYYADLYNECRRLKLSDEAIKQAYADLNRREREKHSQGNVTYTCKVNQTEVIY